MDSRKRSRGEVRLFKQKKVTYLDEPGEYGRPNKPDGWVVIRIKTRTIYLASENYAKLLADHYQIPETNIVCLNRAYQTQRVGIPEEYALPGAEGLALFQERLAKITRTKKPVIIHCKYGSNRTPVAAVLHLLNIGVAPDDAVTAITEAYRQQRDENFVLNKRDNYTLVLAKAGVVLPSGTRKQRIN